MPVLSDLVVFLNLIVVLIPYRQFFDCDTTAFSERYDKFSNI
jgi:hypothetical protein